jgi:hypothetical protein
VHVERVVEDDRERKPGEPFDLLVVEVFQQPAEALVAGELRVE